MKIEEYFNKKHQLLDTQITDFESNWLTIRQKLQLKQIRRRQVWQRMAAAVFLVLLVGSWIRHERVVQQQITSLSQINQELAQREKEYNHQINDKWTEYSGIIGNSSSMEPMLLKELKQLDTLYRNGLYDIKKFGYNERAVIILLDTYEKRLRIIEQLIYEKQKSINYESKHRKIEI
jgi:hypothetical protein